jgi:hypothetical protein
MPVAFAHTGADTVASGTRLQVRVDTDVESGSAEVGDAFRCVVTEPVRFGGRELVPAKSVLYGRIAEVRMYKAWGQSSGVVLRIDTLTSPRGPSVSVQGSLCTDDGDPLSTVDNLRRGTMLRFTLEAELRLPPGFSFDDAETGPNPAVIVLAQDVLRDLGYYTGQTDGRPSSALRSAVAAFQRDHGLAATS